MGPSIRRCPWLQPDRVTMDTIKVKNVRIGVVCIAASVFTLTLLKHHFGFELKSNDAGLELFDHRAYDAGVRAYPGEHPECTKTTTWPKEFIICTHSREEDWFVSEIIRGAGHWEPLVADTLATGLMNYPGSWLLDF